MFGLDDKAKVQRVLPARRDVHILSMEDRYIVTSGQDEAVFDTYEDAEHYGRTIAIEEKSKFFIHSSSGEVLKKECFENCETEDVA